MLTYEQALKLVLWQTPAPRRAREAPAQALGLVLAESATAAIDLPRFDNAAVDGYALGPEPDGVSVPGGLHYLRIIGCAAPGAPFRGRLRPGQAVRILTGAMVPHGADRLIMQEHVARRGAAIIVDRWPDAHRHIRRRGEDLRRGTRVIKAGVRLRPQDIGLLAALGHRSIHVYRPPSVAILTTGDELRQPGGRLEPGQIYECNGALLETLVRREGATVARSGMARDALATIISEVRRGLACDILLVCGGVSVGDKDFARQAMQACGVKEVFWRVNIKPGMPLFFGKRGRTLVFGLPGNPVSVFVNFEEFVKPAIHRFMGRAWRDAYDEPAILVSDLQVSRTRRTHFIRVRCSSQNQLVAEPVEQQGSHHLGSVAATDGWIRVVADRGPWRAGASVWVKREVVA